MPKIYGKRDSIDENVTLPPRGSRSSRSSSVSSLKSPTHDRMTSAITKLPAIPQLPTTPESFKRYCYFAFAAYSTELVETKTFPATLAGQDKFKESEILKIAYDPVSIQAGFISISYDTLEIICSFRGSKKWKQVFNGLDIDTVPYVAEKSVNVHEKFQNAYLLMRPLVDIMKGYADQFHEFKIVFTGHSLGGAIASMASVEYHLRYPEDTGRLLMVNFGSPRVGHESWAKFVNGLRFSKHRVVNVGDPIAHFPLNTFGYHHHRELWMLGGEEKDEEELELLQNSDDLNVLDTSIDKHMEYYGIGISD